MSEAREPKETSASKKSSTAHLVDIRAAKESHKVERQLVQLVGSLLKCGSGQLCRRRAAQLGQHALHQAHVLDLKGTPQRGHTLVVVVDRSRCEG